jgi:hypothetical protein
MSCTSGAGRQRASTHLAVQTETALAPGAEGSPDCRTSVTNRPSRRPRRPTHEVQAHADLASRSGRHRTPADATAHFQPTHAAQARFLTRNRHRITAADALVR